MTQQTFILVADKFAAFACDKRAITISHMESLLRIPEHVFPGKIKFLPGQGVSDDALSSIIANRGRLNSRVMKGHLKGWAALLIEIAAIYASSRYSGSRLPMMDHPLHVPEPVSGKLCTYILHRKNVVISAG